MIPARTRPLGNYFLSLVSENIDLRRNLEQFNPKVIKHP